MPGGVYVVQTEEITSPNGQIIYKMWGSDGNDYYYNPTGETISFDGPNGEPETILPGQTLGFNNMGLDPVFVGNAASLNDWLDDPNYDFDTWLVPMEG